MSIEIAGYARDLLHSGWAEKIVAGLVVLLGGVWLVVSRLGDRRQERVEQEAELRRIADQKTARAMEAAEVKAEATAEAMDAIEHYDREGDIKKIDEMIDE